MQSESHDKAEKTFSAIVDGCPGAIMLQSDGESFSDERRKKLPSIFLYGQTITPAKFSTAGSIDAIGICFQPHALKSVFGMDAHELTSSCLDLNQFVGQKHGKLSDQLLDAPSFDEQVKILSHSLIDRIQHNGSKQDDAIRQAVTEIAKSNGNMTIQELQLKMNISERSLERKFKETIGISPKLFSRICRFQESLNQMRHSKYEKLSDLAYENDYADQSHFIRVFKEFTGFSPLDFKKQTSEEVENFPQIDP